MKQTEEELKKSLIEVENEYDSVYENIPEGLSYVEVQEILKPVSSKIKEISCKLRMIKEPVYDDLPDYGDIMSLKDFVKNVKDGGFIDYDGYGYYIKGDKMTDIIIKPSDVGFKSIRKDFDKIIWFNR